MCLKIFYDLYSHPARSVLMFLRTNKIPYTPCKIDLRARQNKSPEYAAINPLMTVPAMLHGDFMLSESVTITKHLHERFDCPEHWYPKSLRQRSKVNEYLDWQHINRAHIYKVFFEQVVYPRKTRSSPPDFACLVPHIEKMEETLDDIEGYFLQDKPFLCGEDISIADLFGVNEVIQLHPCGFGTIDKRPHLKAWIERVRQTVDQEIFDDVAQLIYKLANKKTQSPAVSKLL